MKVLVINCGSSSLKYQVRDMTNEVLRAKGLVERIGMEGSVITHEKIGMDKYKLVTPMEDHKDAIAQVLMAIQDKEHGVVASMDEIGAVGHRVVHAGEKYADSVLIFADDTALSYLPFLIVHYEHITVVNPAEATDDQLAALDPDEYDQVLFTYSVKTFLQKDAGFSRLP